MTSSPRLRMTPKFPLSRGARTDGTHDHVSTYVKRRSRSDASDSSAGSSSLRSTSALSGVSVSNSSFCSHSMSARGSYVSDSSGVVQFDLGLGSDTDTDTENDIYDSSITARSGRAKIAIEVLREQLLVAQAHTKLRGGQRQQHQHDEATAMTTLSVAASAAAATASAATVSAADAAGSAARSSLSFVAFAAAALYERLEYRDTTEDGAARSRVSSDDEAAAALRKSVTWDIEAGTRQSPLYDPGLSMPSAAVRPDKPKRLLLVHDEARFFWKLGTGSIPSDALRRNSDNEDVWEAKRKIVGRMMVDLRHWRKRLFFYTDSNNGGERSETENGHPHAHERKLCYMSERFNMGPAVLEGALLALEELEPVTLVPLSSNSKEKVQSKASQYEIAVNGVATSESLPRKIYPIMMRWQSSSEKECILVIGSKFKSECVRFLSQLYVQRSG